MKYQEIYRRLKKIEKEVEDEYKHRRGRKGSWEQYYEGQRDELTLLFSQLSAKQANFYAYLVERGKKINKKQWEYFFQHQKEDKYLEGRLSILGKVMDEIRYGK